VIRIISARRATRKERNSMTKLSADKRRQLQRLAAKPDRDIDLSDIPEIREIPSDAVIGRFYRPKKTAVTIRLDADVVAWLKASGAGYQTRINTYLRQSATFNARRPPAMMRIGNWRGAMDSRPKIRIGCREAVASLSRRSRSESITMSLPGSKRKARDISAGSMRSCASVWRANAVERDGVIYYDQSRTGSRIRRK